MDAPNPIAFETKNPDIEEFKEEKNYLIKSNNKSFNLYIKNFTTYLNIYCFYNINDEKYEFEKNYNFNELKNNKYLTICDSIDEVYTQLKIELDKNNTNIKENNDNLIINIPINHIKIEDISFTLNKKIKSEKEQFEDLKEEVSILKNENKLFKTSIQNLENKIINLEKENKMLFEKIKKLENIIEEKIKNNNSIVEEKKLDNILINTVILKNEYKKQNTLINWIKQKTGKNINKFILLFRKSKNGNYSSDFHKFCDNKGPTLSLIKIKNDIIIGGFTPLNWKNDKNGKEVYDNSNQTFIFSLKSMKKYDLIEPNKNAAIYNYSEYGPNFRIGNIRLDTNLNKGDSYSTPLCSFIQDCQSELTGDENFETEELEVFQVRYY